MKTTYKSVYYTYLIISLTSVCQAQTLLGLESQSYIAGRSPNSNESTDGMSESELKKVTSQFQKILELTSDDKSYFEKSSAGPESAFCKEFERDENTFKFTPSVFHTPMGKVGGKCELKDKDGKTLVKIDCDLKKNCLMQGVCILDHKDGRRIGYNFIKFNNVEETKKELVKELVVTNKKVDGKLVAQKTYKQVNKLVTSQVKQSVFAEFDNQRCPFGYGVWSNEHQTSICMDPFRSVAADTKFHKPGDVLFFPALKGLVLPDNSIHNGFMTVRSAGGRIKGAHRFDFYTGICKKSHNKKLLCEDYGPKFFSEIGFGGYLKRKDKSCFYSYFKIKADLKEFVLTQRNFPNLPQSTVQSSVDTWGSLLSLNKSGDVLIAAPEERLVEDSILN
jgi:hypothetical protein